MKKKEQYAIEFMLLKELRNIQDIHEKIDPLDIFFKIKLFIVLNECERIILDEIKDKYE